MDINLLHTFCSHKHDDGNLQEPFSDDSYSYFSDGYVCVRVPLIAHVTKEAPTRHGMVLFTPPHGASGEWIKVDQLPAIECKDCPDCGGYGVGDFCEECGGSAEVMYHGKTGDYDIGCPKCEGYRYFSGCRGGAEVCSRCGGDGRVEINTWRNRLIGPVRVALRLLRLVNALPGVTFFAAAERYGDGVHFRFTGGCGVVMGLSEQVTTDEG